MSTPRASLSTLTALCLAASSCFTAGCQHTARSGTGNAFERKYRHFTYTEVTPIQQSSQKTCGAAALASICHYWGTPASESQLLASHPPQDEDGYPILQLRRIAEVQGLQSFLLTPKENPAAFLENHLTQGRPVLIPIRCPKGRYFGKPLPVVERLDSETLITPGKKWKMHYVVVTGFSQDQWLIMDPAYGIVPVQKEDLLRFWKEMKFAALLCSA